MAINHEIIKNIIGEFYTGELTAEEYCDLFFDAETKVYSVRWAEKDYHSLRHFITNMGDGSPTLTVTGGTAQTPDDFFHELSAYYRYKGAPRKIEFINDHELGHRLAHAYENPTMEYPVAVVYGDTIRFKPDTVKLVTLSYLAWPQETIYSVDYTTGIPVFNEALSSTVKWDIPEVVTIISIILQSLNIQVTQTEIQNKIQQ